MSAGLPYTTPKFTRREVPSVWLHAIWGHVPGYQQALILQPDQSIDDIESIHFSVLKEFFKGIGPAGMDQIGFAFANISVTDHTRKSGHGAVAVMATLRVREAVDHAGRPGPLWKHALLAGGNRIVDRNALHLVAMQLLLHLSGNTEANLRPVDKDYLNYKKDFNDLNKRNHFLYSYVNRLRCLPALSQGSRFTSFHVQDGFDSFQKLYITYPRDTELAVVLGYAAHVASILHRSNFPWLTVEVQCEDRALPESLRGNMICFIPDDALPTGSAERVIRLEGLTPTPDDPQSAQFTANLLFSAFNVRYEPVLSIAPEELPHRGEPTSTRPAGTERRGSGSGDGGSEQDREPTTARLTQQTRQRSPLENTAVMPLRTSPGIPVADPEGTQRIEHKVSKPPYDPYEGDSGRKRGEDDDAMVDAVPPPLMPSAGPSPPRPVISENKRSNSRPSISATTVPPPSVWRPLFVALSGFWVALVLAASMLTIGHYIVRGQTLGWNALWTEPHARTKVSETSLPPPPKEPVTPNPPPPDARKEEPPQPGTKQDLGGAAKKNFDANTKGSTKKKAEGQQPEGAGKSGQPDGKSGPKPAPPKTETQSGTDSQRKSTGSGNVQHSTPGSHALLIDLKPIDQKEPAKPVERPQTPVKGATPATVTGTIPPSNPPRSKLAEE